MGEYNQAIARSSTDITQGERASRATIVMINSYRMSLAEEYMKKYFKEGMDGKCIGRIINRECCEVAWGKQVTVRHLMARFADRVGCNEAINPDALAAIISVIWGFYQGAKEAIKFVKFE